MTIVKLAAPKVGPAMGTEVADYEFTFQPELLAYFVIFRTGLHDIQIRAIGNHADSIGQDAFPLNEGLFEGRRQDINPTGLSVRKLLQLVTQPDKRPGIKHARIDGAFRPEVPNLENCRPPEQDRKQPHRRSDAQRRAGSNDDIGFVGLEHPCPG